MAERIREMAGKENPPKKGLSRNKIKAKTVKLISDKSANNVENAPKFSITAPSVWR
ncbi:MAG: hypothetical protein WBC05_01000 [Sedimentisphaerales bacterium]